MSYIAHKRKDGKVQLLKDHLAGTAALAADFASPFGAQDCARRIGLLHDIGKYSAEGQKRIRGDGSSVDHSTAGAKEAAKLRDRYAAYCIAGHHSGIPNGGSKSSDNNSMPTLAGRLKKRVPDYGRWKTEITPGKISMPVLRIANELGFTASFFVRMLYSCLVDADWLDTEHFMSDKNIQRGNPVRPGDLLEKLEQYISRWENPATPIHQKRNEILSYCLKKANFPKGAFRLTVPTGGGKTVSSFAFALRHAVQNHMDRVIYVMPYLSVIEQNAKVFKDIIGEENVLEHHSDISYDDPDENTPNPKRLATENWDAPVIVTTNVQFFESLFANKSSKCRKLHNIANSVLIFDEAQMFPPGYLIPCVKAIAELVENYGCTAVLCTATQPSLRKFFPKGVPVIEICEHLDHLFSFFHRVRFNLLGELNDWELSRRLNSLSQVLCIVNTRRQAYKIFERLEEEGRYHLSAWMCPSHREKILAEIRSRLACGKPCRVVSTSLIEAGVDVDFPAVYRAYAGLDSIIQAAGRCNREGNFPAEESIVSVFQPETQYKTPPSLKRQAEVGKMISQKWGSVESPEAIRAYFDTLFRLEGDFLDSKQIVEKLDAGVPECSFPFADIAQDFSIVEEDTIPVLIPFPGKAEDCAARLRTGEFSRGLLREVGPYCVNIPRKYAGELERCGTIERIDREIAILSDLARYSDETGLSSFFQCEAFYV